MGNETVTRIIILDSEQQSRAHYQNLFSDPRYKKFFSYVVYNTFNSFIEKQNPEKIKDIIVKCNTRDDNQQKVSKLKAKCGFLSVANQQTLKDQLITYVKQYGFKINVFLFVDTIGQLKIQHFEKPYIRLVSSNLKYILKTMQNSKEVGDIDRKTARMFDGLHRRIMVKVINPAYNDQIMAKQKQKKIKNQNQNNQNRKQNTAIQIPEANVDKQNDLDEMKKGSQKQTIAKQQQSKINKQGKLKKDEKINKQQTPYQRDKNIFKQNKVEAQFFGNIQKFEKSFISTSCQFVICTPELFHDVLDCKKKCDQEYNIVVKGSIGKKGGANLNRAGEDEQEFDITEKETSVWAQSYQLQVLINQMKACSQISGDETPYLAKNVIICGNDDLFKKLISTEGQQFQDQIKATLEKKSSKQEKELRQERSKIVLELLKKDQGFSQKSEIERQKLHKQVLNHFINIKESKQKAIDIAESNQKKSKKNKNPLEYLIGLVQKQIDTENVVLKPERVSQRNFNVNFVTGDDLQSKLPELISKTLHTYIVVFSTDEFLERVKKFLRANNYHERVQMTSISDSPKNGQNDEQRLEYKKKYILNEVPYLIKFQIGPIISVHLFNPNSARVSFFNEKVSLKVEVIRNIEDLKNNYINSYNKIINSSRLVCNLEDYQKQIRPILKDYEDSDFAKRLRIIIFDENSENLHKFASNPQNDDKLIEFIQFDKGRIQNFMLHTKASTVAIQFFGAGVLSNYEKQCRLLNDNKSSYQANLRSSTLSSNQVMRQILSDTSEDISTKFNLGFVVFTIKNENYLQELTSFQQGYIPTFSKLWTLGYDIIKQLKNTQNPKANKYEILMQTIKEQICILFYKCKSYDLLNVRDDDFKSFYIDQINQCTSLIDLQISCVHILSLPHGFSSVISALLKNPKKFKLAVKIFVAYIIIILSYFFNFGAQHTHSIKLSTYVGKQEGDYIIKHLNEKDFIYTTDFVFCIDHKENDAGKEQKKFHSFVFNFNSLEVLQASKMKYFSHIEKYAFYKEGPQYIIPPFTKFVVKSIKKVHKIYEVQLDHILDQKHCFASLLLKQNNMSEQTLWQALKFQILNADNKVDQDYQLQNDKKSISRLRFKNSTAFRIENQKSLYKRAEELNMIKSKQEAKNDFKKGNNYQEFFLAKNNFKNLTAQVYNQREILQIKANKLKTKAEINEQKILSFGVEKAYLFYNAAEYKRSIEILAKMLKIIDGKKLENKKQSWQQISAKTIKKNVETFYQKRQNYILGSQKRKFWTVSLLEDSKVTQLTKREDIFKLRPKSEKWKVRFEPKYEIFSLSYGGPLFNNSIKKVVKFKKLVGQKAPDNWFSLEKPLESNKMELFTYFVQFVQAMNKQNSNDPDNKQQNAGSEDEKIDLKKQTLFSALFPNSNQKQLNWNIFYLGENAVVTQTKQHFRRKLFGECHHKAKADNNKMIKGSKDEFEVNNQQFCISNSKDKTKEKFFISNEADEVQEQKINI